MPKSAFHDPAGSGEIPALTGIRGLAAVGVMAFHWGVGRLPLTSFIGHACARGYIFVDLFFLLSGLVMARAYSARFKRNWAWKDYVSFIYIRLARIYPLYLVVVVVTVAGMVLRPHHAASVSPLVLVANLLLVQTWIGTKSYVLVAWSLSTEWAAYLIFPLLVRLVLQSRALVAWLACSFAVIVIIGLGFYGVVLGKAADFALDAAFPVPGELLRCFAGFTLGIGVYRLAASPRIQEAGADRIAAATIAVLAIAWMVQDIPDVVVYACFLILLLCLALNRRLLPAISGNKVVFLIGEWSYSMYLTHMFYFAYVHQKIFGVLVRHMPLVLAKATDFLLLFALTIAVSAASFRFIEVPARRKLRALINLRRLSPSLEPSAP